MTTAVRKVLIADDELPARERLQRLLTELPGFDVAATCGTGAEALELISKLKPDIALLDIRMPGMTGLEVARHLNVLERPPAVVFTTAYEQYAVDAFEAHAVGYLLKPVRRERLEAALEHAARLKPPALRVLAEQKAFAPRRHIAVRVRDDLRLIPVADIAFFRAEQKYVTVRHINGEDLLEESLRNLETEFAAVFVRAHRNVLVAIPHVEALERQADGGYCVRMRGTGERLAVSRRQLTQLKERLGSGR
ncbi:MAG TPA: LytTR family DNA-binding domain-containing protein [Gammaproteobacteria bacterium]|jgi:two-component system response regulator AlgR